MRSKLGEESEDNKEIVQEQEKSVNLRDRRYGYATDLQDGYLSDTSIPIMNSTQNIDKVGGIMAA